MSPRPTGRVRPSATGYDLVITRTFRAAPEEVWQSVTDPDSTARWIGRWERQDGNRFRLQLAFEDGQPWTEGEIEVCEPPRHFAYTTKFGGGTRFEVTLAAKGDTTELTFIHHLKEPTYAGDFGPGWEYYFDNLVAARDGAPLAVFTDYYPAQKPHFVDEAAAAASKS